MIDDPDMTVIHLIEMTPPHENLWNSEEINNDVAEFLKNFICDENEWQTLRDIKIKYLGQLFFRGLSMTIFCREINNDNEAFLKKQYDEKGDFKWKNNKKVFISSSCFSEFAPFLEMVKILEGRKKIAEIVVTYKFQDRHSDTKEYSIKKEI